MAKIWRSIEEKEEQKRNPVAHANRQTKSNESLNIFFDEKALNVSSSRRDFLKLFGFSVASAAIAASCEQPVRKAIPYLIRPEKITPGIANYYASTYYDGQEYCSVLVKVRDGRPIKIEGNELSSVTKGGTNARVQASVLSLYDDARYKVPSIDGKETSWELADIEIQKLLMELSGAGEKIVLVTPTIISPSTLKAIGVFLKAYPGTKHIQYDAVSASGISKANRLSFGKEVIPSYRFDHADLIISFGADFLGTWLSPIEFAKQYSKTRSLSEGQKKISRHIQFESGLSLTGSNADERVPIKPSQEKTILTNLYNELAQSFGYPGFSAPTSPIDIKKYAKELIRYHKRSLVVSGTNDYEIQLLVNAINFILGSYEYTIDLDNPFPHYRGKDDEMHLFTESLGKGEVGGVIFYNVNPVYNYPKSDQIQEGLGKCKLVISIASEKNETSEMSKFICPDHHYLESWNDAKIRKNKYSLTQPTIHPIFNTRQAQDSLLRWANDPTPYHDYMKDNWQKTIFPKSKTSDFFKFWNTSLRDGIFEIKDSTYESISSFPTKLLNEVFQDFPMSGELFELCLYEKVGIGNGKHANNPWLQEMPDPITKATWDNYLCISPHDAKLKGWKTGDLLKLDEKITIPCLVQPGQTKGTVSAALGYGRKQAGKVAEGVGQNFSEFIEIKDGNRKYESILTSISKVGEGYQIAQTQTHNSMEGREIIRETSLKDYLNDPTSGNHSRAESDKKNATLYKGFDFKGHHWGMAIDLNKCIGCSACIIACSAENNVPVVGKKEVLRAHEMHWIRIDRYFEGDIENPKIYRQPVMCQQCDNAPCENVCPVAATNHSDEGINQMAYNRCIGTRYCNNNCPYKVRRFNWFDYTTADALKNNTVDPAGMTVDLKRMVLNPDVTVRSKGVMEKCTFCIQRIQEKKLTAKLDNRVLEDGEIKTACQQACPAEAIVFGDLNNKESKVSKMFADPRNYHLLEELHTLPSVGYLTKVSNREES